MLLGLPDFDMVSAESVAEACALLARHDGKARLFAGGTDLLIMMKHRKATPRQLINIKRIAGLDHISYDAEGGLRMGAGPADSVTDAWGQVHGLPWLYVADAGLFPRCSEINPYLTIMGLADRVAERVRDNAPELLA